MPSAASKAHSSRNGAEQGLLVPCAHVDVTAELIKRPVPGETPYRLHRCSVLGCRGGKAPPERVEAAPRGQPDAGDRLPERQISSCAAHVIRRPEAGSEQVITRSAFMAPSPEPFTTEAFKLGIQLRADPWFACGARLGGAADKHQAVGMHSAPGELQSLTHTGARVAHHRPQAAVLW